MKNTTTKTAKTENENQKHTEREKQTLADISRQIEMALTSDKTPEPVKACIKTIIIEASDEAGLPLADFSLVRAAFPNIIENLNKDYGRGIYHSIHAILQYNTDAFQKFYDDRLDQDAEDLARLLSQVMKHPKIPTRLYNAMTDELVETDADTDSPEWILANLEMQLEKENKMETN